MLARGASKKKIGENRGGEKLLSDIEVISKSLYGDRGQQKGSNSSSSIRGKSIGKAPLPELKSKSKGVDKDSMEKEKKSIWSWTGLKALSHVRNRRFNCAFSLQVHSVEGLPPFFDDLTLVVHWKRRDEELVTHPVMVTEGVAEFEDHLTHSCSVYGSRNGPHHSAKYEAKHFLLYASVYGSPEHDLGKHRMDLTRILPLTLEELEEENSSGKWTTSFKLSGKAKGAVLNVSFGYRVIGNPSVNSKDRSVTNVNDSRQSSTGAPKFQRLISHGKDGSGLRRAESLPVRNSSSSSSSSSLPVEKIKDLHEILPTSTSELSESVKVLYQKFDEEKARESVDIDPSKDLYTDPVEHLKSGSFESSAAGKEDRLDEVEHLKSGSFESSAAGKEDRLDEAEFEFSIMEQFVEPSSKEQMKVEEGKSMSIQCSNTEPSEFQSLPTTIETEYMDSNPSVGDSGKPHQDEIVASNFDCEIVGPSTKELQRNDLELAIDCASGIASAETSVPLKFDTHHAFSEDADAAQSRSSVDDSGKSQKDEIGVSAYDSLTVGKSARELLLQDLESALDFASGLATERIDLLEGEFLNEDDSLEVKSNGSGVDGGMPLSVDDVALDDVDSVANEFLHMLGMEHSPSGLSSDSDPESPRGRLLRQFERDNLADGCSLFDFDMDSIQAEFEYNASYSDRRLSEELNNPTLLGNSEVMHGIETFPTRSISKASELEGLETEALMHEWGLDEKAFQRSPPLSRNGFGSPIDLPPEDPHELPPLGDGLGPFIQTESGGFLRSMNPSLFRNAKNQGNLIMQVSTPVVMPAEMGSGVMEIMQHLASIGIEKLSVQANKIMPLDDMTGKTMQQIAWEGLSSSEEPQRHDFILAEPELEHNIPGEGKRIEGRSSKPRPSKAESRLGHKTDTEYASLEDLAPLAMEKIEALSVEGLRIQSGMSDEDAPSNITPQSIGEFSVLEGKRVSGESIGLEGTGGLKLLDIKGDGDDVDGLMGLSLTLDEWMKLDAGEFDDEEDNISEKTSRILAAHHANSLQKFSARSQGEKRRGKGRKGGLLGNNFTVALMMQLRDPLRNYEPVGTPMLALIQVERVFFPPKPKIYSTVSEFLHSKEKDEDEPKIIKQEELTEETKDDNLQEKEQIAQYKITEVHCAGFKTEPTKKKLWGSSTQQQSGSRWLLANGMGKKNKHPLMKSKADPKSIAGDTLWSVSSRARGIGAASKTNIRNPNIVLSK